MTSLRDPAVDIQNAELRELLKEMDPRGGLATIGVDDKRRAYRLTASRGGAPEPVHSAADLVVPGPAGDIPIRIYRPKLATEQVLPALLYLHGGGFVSGDLDTHDPVCRMLANHVPAIVVAVNYRLAPEHPQPAAAEDSFAVLAWLAAYAGSFSADSNRIIVVGDSAGGNLAAVLALMARDQGGPRLAGQLLIYPMLDATLSSESLVENALIPPFTLVDCVYSWQLYLAGDKQREDAYISPLHARNLKGLPPTLVLTAEYDILADEGESYAQRLKDAGVPTEHEHFPDMIHGFFQWSGSVAAARLAMNRVVQFIQRLG